MDRFIRQCFPYSLNIGAVLCLATLITSCDSGPSLSGNTRDQPVTGAAQPLDVAYARGSDAALALTVELTGSMVLPAVATRKTARADVVFDRTSKRLFAVLQSGMEQALDVYIREGGVDEVGAVVATLYREDGVYTLGEGVVLSARQAELLEDGDLYIDAHRADFPNGFLRAQLTNAPVEIAVLPTLEDIQAKVLTPVCSGCHNGSGQTLPGIMNLAIVERSLGSLVGVYSIGEPTLLRVDPANPEESVLVRKIEGTHQAGSRMPFRGSKLSEQTIAAIRQWVADGALR